MGSNTKSYQWAKKQKVSPAHKLYAFSFKTDEDYFYNNTTPDRFLWSLTKRDPNIGVRLVCGLLEEKIYPRSETQQYALEKALYFAHPIEFDYETVIESLLQKDNLNRKTFYANKAIASFLGYRCNVLNECGGVYNCVVALIKYLELNGEINIHQNLSDWIRSKITFGTWISTFDFYG